MKEGKTNEVTITGIGAGNATITINYDTISAEIQVEVTPDVATPELFTYSISNGKANITGLSDNSVSKIVVPGKVKLNSNSQYDENGTEYSVVIGDNAFKNCANLTIAAILDGVTSIGRNTFFGCTSLATVNYIGTQEQWNNITINSGNDPLNNATKVYNFVVQ